MRMTPSQRRWLNSYQSTISGGPAWISAEHQRPLPIYLGDEYPAPLIGADELERHWARVSSRIKSASVSSTLHAFDVVDEAIVRAVVCSRWRLTTRESDLERTGASWITWLLVHRGERYRIFHQMESQVYLAGADAAPGR
jgi:hypothetical protein